MLDAFGDCPLGESGVEGRMKKEDGAHENNAHHNHHRLLALHRARRALVHGPACMHRSQHGPSVPERFDRHPPHSSTGVYIL